jgi:hypothetical protein
VPTSLRLPIWCGAAAMRGFSIWVAAAVM